MLKLADDAHALGPTGLSHPDFDHWYWRSNKAIRWTGVCLLIAGCVFGYFAVYVPVAAVFAGANAFYSVPGLVAVTTGLVVSGTAALILGKHARHLIVHEHEFAQPMQIFGTAILVALTFGAEFGFTKLLALLGYAAN